MNRIILHCDCNSFYASCEELLNPELKKFPMAVAGDPENRHGIILAKNQKAKTFGIATAEPVWKAYTKCPELKCVPPHHKFYEEINRQINEIFLQFTDLVEKASIDESYLDVTNSIHLFASSPREIADIIREKIKHEVGITVSVGVSFCKCIAKFGSDYKKPDAVTVIMRDDMPEIFWKSDVSELYLSGRKTTEKLRRLGINTIGDLALYDKEKLIRFFGKQGEQLWNNANGEDYDPVTSFYDKHEAKSIGNAMTFRRDLKGESDIKAGIYFLSDSVACRLRSDKKKCTVVQVGIKDSEFRTIQRQKTLINATYLQKEIANTAIDIIEENWNMNKEIRLLSVTAAGLINEDEVFTQLDMFAGNKGSDEKQNKIENTLDDIRKKFGTSSIKFGYFKDEETGIK